MKNPLVILEMLLCKLVDFSETDYQIICTTGSPAGGESPCDDGSTGGEVVVSTQVDGGGGADELRREMIDLRMQLDRERRHRLSLEEHIRTLEAPSGGFPERVKEVSSHPTPVSSAVPLSLCL